MHVGMLKFACMARAQLAATQACVSRVQGRLADLEVYTVFLLPVIGNFHPVIYIYTS